MSNIRSVFPATYWNNAVKLTVSFFFFIVLTNSINFFSLSFQFKFFFSSDQRQALQILSLLNIIRGLVEAFRQFLHLNIMNKEIFTVILSIIIFNTIITYNINKNVKLKSYNNINICELDIEINHDEKVSLFLKKRFKYNNSEINKFYKEIYINYINQKKNRKNYIEESVKKEKRHYALSKFLFDKKNNKILFKYKKLNNNFDDKTYLRKILKEDIEKNISIWVYFFLEKQIDKDLINLNKYIGSFKNYEFANKENSLFHIFKKDYKKIYLLKKVTCKFDQDYYVKIYIIVNFILLSFFIIYLSLQREKKLK